MVSGERRKAADRRRMLVDAAMFDFGEAGIAEVSTAAIVARAGIAQAYLQMMTQNPNALRCPLHAWAAASDPDMGPVARETHLDIWREVARMSGEGADTVRDLMAHGMLLAVAAALDITAVFLNCLPHAQIEES